MVRPVATEAPTGGDRISLDTIGIVQALTYSTCINGDLTATWQMILNPKTDHRALTPGRQVLIPVGSQFWRGTLNNPHRGDVWELNATGAAALAANYDAIAPTSGNAYNLDEVVDAAIGRGLPWTRPAALPTTEGNQGSGAGTVADVLNAVCDAENKIWRVDRAGALTAVDRPTAATYLLMANDTAGGRSVQGFATDVHVTYIKQSTYEIATTLRSAASRPFGRFEQPLDVTSRGPISTAKANAIGDNWLARRGPRLAFTGAFAVSPYQLLTLGGTPVDPATVESAGAVVKVMLTDPDTAAGELAYTQPSVAVGQTDYDEDAGALTVTPLDVNRTGLAAVFG